MRQFTMLLTVAVLIVIAAPAIPADEKSGLNDEGFVTAWLLLAPIPMSEGQTGAEAVDKQQVPNESQLKPKAGDELTVGGKELTWKQYKPKDYFFDFNDHLGQQTEDSVGYAVCYIQAPADMKVQLKTGSDDQAKVYLNGKEVFKKDEARALEKDQDTTPVDLKKGVNVLVFKVVNEKVDWSGCARFVDKSDQPVKGLKATVTP